MSVLCVRARMRVNVHSMQSPVEASILSRLTSLCIFVHGAIETEKGAAHVCTYVSLRKYECRVHACTESKFVKLTGSTELLTKMNVCASHAPPRAYTELPPAVNFCKLR
jgi:hypothetical protein